MGVLAAVWDFIAPAAGGLGIIALVAAAILVARSTLTRSTIDLYRQDNEALRGRIATLEDEKDAARDRIATLEGKVAAQASEMTTLRDLATGATAITALDAKADAHHHEVMEGFDKLAQLVTARTER